MSTAEARRILSKIEFLHFKYEVREQHESHVLIITINTPDTRDRTKMVDIIHQNSLHLDWFESEQIFIDHVWDFTCKTLIHEAGELFKVNGQDPYNEHEGSEHKWAIIKAMFQKDNVAVRTNFPSPIRDRHA